MWCLFGNIQHFRFATEKHLGNTILNVKECHILRSPVSLLHANSIYSIWLLVNNSPSKQSDSKYSMLLQNETMMALFLASFLASLAKMTN